jgi:putative colanic acid biosynthesis glycosyltransferase
MVESQNRDCVPFFSIITVVLNDLNGLQQTEASIKEQVWEDFEWIVIDGASKDGTVAYLSQLEEFSCKWISERDQGIYEAMNKGIDRSHGLFTVFLNAGDSFLHGQVLQNVHKEIISLPDRKVDILFGGVNLRFPSGRNIYRGPRNFRGYINHGLPAIHQATYFRTVWAKRKKYDPSYKICGDYYLVAQFFRNGLREAYLDEPLVDFQVGGLSYQSPYELLMEAYRVQQEVLGLPIRRRVWSFFRRLIATLGFFILSQKRFVFTKSQEKPE